MAYRMPHLCKETTNTSGITSPITHYALLGAVSGRRTISGGLGNNDTSTFTVLDNATPPQFEVFDGTYIAGTNKVRPDVVRDSSNGGSSVNWPASGVREIYPTPIATALEPVISAVAPTGLIARTAQYVYAGRTITNSAEFLSLANGSGVSGNPALSAAFDVLRRSAGASTEQRTMTPELILAAATMLLSSNDFELLGPGGATDRRMKLLRSAADSYRIQERRAGAYSNVLTVVDIPDWLPRMDVATSSSNTEATVEAALVRSVVVPAVGTWAIRVITIVRASASVNANQGTVEFDLLQKINAGSPVAVDTGVFSFGAIQTDNSQCDATSVYTLLSATNGSTYEYSTNIVVTGPAALNASSPLRVHSMHLECVRRV
jgi:hypothetical protein